MSIRVVFFSDTHLGFDYPVRPRSDRLRRGPDFFANFQTVLNHARETRADLVVHGGDFFFRSKVHPLIVDQAYQRLCEFADSGIDVVIAPGNHERSVLPPSLFLSHPHVHVLDRPRTYHFDIRDQHLTISGFPYLKNIRARFGAALVECEAKQGPADYRLLCLHHAVDGAVVGPGDFTFRNRPDVIACAQLPAHFDAILAGHVHRHQVLPYAAPVVYCGSVERTSFAEKNETKGFCEVVLHRDASPDVTFHELPTRPMVDFDARRYTHTTRLIDAFSHQSARWSPGAIIRVRLVSYPSKQLSRALANVVAGPIEFSVPRASARARL